MNIVICEDDIQFCNYIKSILEKYIVNNHFNSKIVLTKNNTCLILILIKNKITRCSTTSKTEDCCC